MYNATARSAYQADNTGQYQGIPLGGMSGVMLNITIPAMAIEFWVEND
ncbi:hypothetical protein [Collimonas antrihumi]|nr:hypothetical protein [Collimonas antrihumi]